MSEELEYLNFPKEPRPTLIFKDLSPEHFSESYTSEQNLIRELKRCNEDLEKDQKDFEEDLLAISLNVDKELVIHNSFTHKNEITLDFDIEKISYMDDHELSIVISKYGDVVGNPYLYIKTKLSDLDYDTLCDVLQINIKLFVGKGVHLSHFSLVTNIFIAKLCEKEIYECDDYTRIPLMIMHNGDEGMIKLISSRSDEIKVGISCIHTDLLEKMKGLQLVITRYFYVGPLDHPTMRDFLGKYIGGNYTVDEKIRGKRTYSDMNASKEFMYISSHDIRLLNDKLIQISHFTKFLLFRFESKPGQNPNDLLIFQPTITDVIMTAITNESETPHTFSNILTMSFMGVTLFIVPLTHEISNWDDIKNCVKECKFETTRFVFDCIKVDIVSDIPYDNYNVVMTCISFDIGNYNSGILWRSYYT